MNAIDLLTDQHNVVIGAIDAMLDADVIDDEELLAVADKLVAHMVIEEHVFYPRVRELKAELVSESFEEHTVARFELGRAILAEGTEKKTRITVLKEILEHHIEEEEDEMFPKVKAGIDERELEDLGVKMKALFDKAVQKGFSRLVVEGYTLRGGAHGVRWSESTRPAPSAATKRKTPQQHGRTPKKTARTSESRRH
jgi:hemerythrin superfamily protein